MAVERRGGAGRDIHHLPLGPWTSQGLCHGILFVDCVGEHTASLSPNDPSHFNQTFFGVKFTPTRDPHRFLYATVAPMIILPPKNLAFVLGLAASLLCFTIFPPAWLAKKPTVRVWGCLCEDRDDRGPHLQPPYPPFTVFSACFAPFLEYCPGA